MDYSNTYTYRDSGFFSRTFVSVFSGKNFSFFLLAFLITFIPVVGPLWAAGYFVKRAQRIAWGINDIPTKNDLDFTSCIKAGAVYALCYIVCALVLVVFNRLFAGFMGGTLATFIGLFVAVIINSLTDLYILHYAIYDDFGALFTVKPFMQVKERINSFLRMNLAVLAIQWIFSIINIVLLASLFVKFGFDSLALLNTASIESRAEGLIFYIISNIGFFALFLLIFSLTFALFRVLQLNATAFWLMGSNVVEWPHFNDPAMTVCLDDGEMAHVYNPVEPSEEVVEPQSSEDVVEVAEEVKESSLEPQSSEECASEESTSEETPDKEQEVPHEEAEVTTEDSGKEEDNASEEDTTSNEN